jgi:hypothetical protein
MPAVSPARSTLLEVAGGSGADVIRRAVKREELGGFACDGTGRASTPCARAGRRWHQQRTGTRRRWLGAAGINIGTRFLTSGGAHPTGGNARSASSAKTRSVRVFNASRRCPTGVRLPAGIRRRSSSPGTPAKEAGRSETLLGEFAAAGAAASSRTVPARRTDGRHNQGDPARCGMIASCERPRVGEALFLSAG